MDDLKLNSEQKKAITHPGGPLLIVAGAGTGKTTVITQRIKYLLSEKKVNPKEILALTFTEKAAEEILRRVDESMPLGYEEPWLSTFHAFCERILRDEALEIGLDPSFKIISEPQQWLLVRKNLFDLDLKHYRPLGNPSKFISAILSFFSRAKDEIITPDDLYKYTQEQNRKTFQDDAQREEYKKLQEIAHAYQKYQNILLKENFLDFGDLLFWVINLFKKRPSVLKKYQTQFKHILIDEFQDTNIAQYEIIKLLAPATQNPDLTVVGDDDQAIFKFRGASISNILDFKKDYPQSQTVVLTLNYRSTQEILNSSHQLIQNNNPNRLEVKLKINKKLKSSLSQKGLNPQVLQFENLEDEAEQIVELILKLIKTKGLNFSDFALLGRANNHLDPLVLALKRAQIPYTLVGNRGLFNQEEIKTQMSFLRLLVNRDDNTAAYFLLISDVFKLSPKDITTVLSEARKTKNSLFEIMKQNPNDCQGLKNITELFFSLEKEIYQKQITQILYEFLTRSGYVKFLVSHESIENNLKIKNINLFFNKVKEFENQTDNPSVFEFVDYLDLLIEAGENPAQAEIEDIDTVKLLTVHSAKGLEFPVVFMTSLTSDRFPTRNRNEIIPIPNELVKETLLSQDYHLEEERRLFYVAATRAKKLLYFSWAKNYGGIRDKKPSGFISETIHDKIVNPKSSNNSNHDKFFHGSQKQTVPVMKKINISPLANGFISYSQMETFQTCQLKYYYKYVIHVEGAPTAALSFGQTLHRTLRDFHRRDLIKQEKTLADLLIGFENHFAEFTNGYQDKKHRQEAHQKGKELLLAYYRQHSTLFGTPIYLEKPFKIKIGGVTLIGAIDRIDSYQDKTLEIIDYKTGSSEEKEKKIDKDSQLTIYAMAAQEVLGITPDKLTLYFLENNFKVSTTRSNEQIQEQKESIQKTIAEIKISKFPAKIGMWCKFCEFNKVCPAYSQGKNNL